MSENKQEIKVEISAKEFKKIIEDTMVGSVKQAIKTQEKDIHDSIKNYFDRPLFNNKQTDFEKGLDWAIEDAFRLGIQIAFDELDFKRVVADKAKEMMMQDDFINELANAKIRASLGLPEKEI